MSSDVSLPSFLHPFARPAAGRSAFLNIVAGTGAEVTDAQGRVYVDALGSLWYCQVGHGRARDRRRRARRRCGASRCSTPSTGSPTRAPTSCADRLAEHARRWTAPGCSSPRAGRSRSRRRSSWPAWPTPRRDPQRTLIVSRHPSYHGVNYGGDVRDRPARSTRPVSGRWSPTWCQVPWDDLDALDQLPEPIGARIGGRHRRARHRRRRRVPAPRRLPRRASRPGDRWGALPVLDEVIMRLRPARDAVGGAALRCPPRHGHLRQRGDVGVPAPGRRAGRRRGARAAGVRPRVRPQARLHLQRSSRPAAPPLWPTSTSSSRKASSTGPRASAQQLGKGLADLVDAEHVLDVRGTMGIWAIGLAPHLHAPDPAGRPARLRSHRPAGRQLDARLLPAAGHHRRPDRAQCGRYPAGPRRRGGLTTEPDEPFVSNRGDFASGASL